MASRYCYGDANPLVAPVLTAQAVAVGDLTGLSSGNVIRAEDETWDTSLAQTQFNFAQKFLGVSGQKKVAATARVYGNSEDNTIRIDTDGAYEFDCASTSFAVGDLVGPAKQSGNALESQKVVAVADESLAIGRVVDATSSETRVLVRILSKMTPRARQASAGELSAETVAATNAITAGENGKTFFLSSATEFVSTLPAPAAGLRYTFIVAAAPSGASYTIVTASSANIILGHVLTSQDAGGTSDSETSGGDTISFVDSKAVVGDRVDLVSDGTSWFARCSCKVFDAITITTAS